MPRLGRFGKGLRRRVLVGATAAVALVSTLVVTPGRSSADVCLGNWAPVLRDVTINQGLGTYTPLARGKSTLVRLFLSEPVCAPAGSVQLTSAALTATDGTTTLASNAPTTPANLGPNFPFFDAYTAAPTNNAPGNPIFVLPNFGANDTKSGQFTATFTATIKYQFQSTSGGPFTPGSVTITQMPGVTGGAITAAVGPKPNALRILAVPMGDASAPMGAQFPEAKNGGVAVSGEYADTAVQNGMQTLSRVMPVADGIGDLASTTGGLRYRLDDAAMIDLGPKGLNLMTSSTGGKFCGSGLNFTNSNGPSVSSELLAFLQGWNKANPTVQADRVMGVVWQNVSLGADASCAEGMAAVNGSVGWVRAFVDQTINGAPAPSITGAILGMETSHTWGSVPLTDTRDSLQDYHSKNLSADPNNTMRAYNLSLAQWLASPMSDMHYSGTSTAGMSSAWNNNTALLEQADYLWDQCQLTPGMSATQCPVGSSPGSVGVAGATGSVVVTGTTDGTVAGTNVYSYFASVGSTPDDPASNYQLVQIGPAGVQLASDRVPVRFGESDHDSGTFTQVTTGSINAAVPLNANTQSIQLVNAATGTVLYSRAVGSAPQVTQIPGTVGVTNLRDFTNAPADETQAALSPNGRFIAWVTSAGIVVQGRDPVTNLPTGSPSAPLAGGNSPGWSADGTSLTYTSAPDTGDVFVVGVNTSANPPSFGTPTMIYNHILQAPPVVGSTSASHPSYSPDGSRIAIAINSAIWSITANGGANSVICNLSTFLPTTSCISLVHDGNDATPAWGSTGGSGAGLIAYAKAADLYTLDPNQAGTSQTKRVAGASSPAWGGTSLAFGQNGNIWVADTTKVAADHTYSGLSQLTTGGADNSPSLSAAAQAVTFDRPAGANGRDVLDGTIGPLAGGSLQFSASDPNPANLRADLYAKCGGVNEPILADVPPTSTSGSSATWSLNYDTTRSCSGATIGAQVGSGTNLSPITTVKTLPPSPPSSSTPGAAIAVPTTASTYLQYDPVVAVGSNTDNSGGTNGSGAQMKWLLTGPAGSGFNNTAVGTGTRIELDAPTPGGWTLGPYTLTLQVTNGSGQTATASTTYTVLADPNHRGVNVTVAFNPKTLCHPSSPSGENDAFLQVIPQNQDLSKIDPATVQISRIGDYATSIPIDTESVGGWLPVGGGSYVAIFNTQVLYDFIAGKGLVGLYVPVVITGSAPGFSIRGFDSANPITSSQSNCSGQ